MAMASTCQFRRSDGTRCGANAQSGKYLCVFQDPAKAAAGRRVSRLGAINRSRPRIQEFVSRWFADDGHSFREIARQQWNFSHLTPHPKSRNYHVQLTDVTVLDWSSCRTSAGSESRIAQKSAPVLTLETGLSTSNPATFRGFI